LPLSNVRRVDVIERRLMPSNPIAPWVIVFLTTNLHLSVTPEAAFTQGAIRI